MYYIVLSNYWKCFVYFLWNEKWRPKKRDAGLHASLSWHPVPHISRAGCSLLHIYNSPSFPPKYTLQSVDTHTHIPSALENSPLNFNYTETYLHIATLAVWCCTVVAPGPHSFFCLEIYCETNAQRTTYQPVDYYMVFENTPNSYITN